MPWVAVAEVGDEVPGAATVEVGFIVPWIVVVLTADNGEVPGVTTLDVGFKVPGIAVETVGVRCVVGRVVAFVGAFDVVSDAIVVVVGGFVVVVEGVVVVE